MRIPFLPCLIAGLGISAFTPPFIAAIAGDDIPQCFLESEPCGTAEHLYQRMQECFRDPNMCRKPRVTADGSAKPDLTSPTPKQNAASWGTVKLPPAPVAKDLPVAPDATAAVQTSSAPVVPEKHKRRRHEKTTGPESSGQPE